MVPPHVPIPGSAKASEDSLMRPISWLHVSDIHMSLAEGRSQDIVLGAMCDDIRGRRSECVLDFVLVTGDLAYSGSVAEYDMIIGFLDALVDASGVRRERVFCIPGNHDIERERQRFCFHGALQALTDPNSADAFLSDPTSEDFTTLLQRQENYRSFRDSHFVDQERIPTSDGLGYVAHFDIEGVHFAIVALDSAWLANGGQEDHLRLLIGERQIINAIDLLEKGDVFPHVVIAMTHHPLHLLRDSDRHSVQTHIEKHCHFHHCGHLHRPEERTAGLHSSGCLTVTAGASYQSHQSPNTYTVVELDLLLAKRVVTTFRYDQRSASFQSPSSHEYSMEVSSSLRCDLDELARELENHINTPWPHYLAALLLDQKAEVPVASSSGHTFASAPAAQVQPDCELKDATGAFFGFRNTLRLFFGREKLANIIRSRGAAVAQFSAVLINLCASEPALGSRLSDQEDDARRLAVGASSTSFTYTLDLWNELASRRDWDLLRERVERNLPSDDPSLNDHRDRFLALALANSADREDRRRAATMYRELADVASPIPSDLSNLALCLFDDGQVAEAKAIILDGLERLEWEVCEKLREIGYSIVAATGDRIFRSRLDEPSRSKGESDGKG